MLGDELFGPPHVSVRDYSCDLYNLVRRKVNPHVGASFLDVDVCRRMVSRVYPDFEPVLANECGH
jgi:hypothetical protein